MDIETLADSAGEWEAVMSDMLAEMAGETEAAMSQLMADSEAVNEALTTMLRESDPNDFLDGLLIDHSKKWRGRRKRGIIGATVTNKPFFHRYRMT